MPYLCKNCGNKTSFKEFGEEVAEVTEWRNVTQYVDENGEETDMDYNDTTNSETNEAEFNGDGNVECCECNEEVEDVSEEEWEQWEEGVTEEDQKEYVPPEPKSSKLLDMKKELMDKI